MVAPPPERHARDGGYTEWHRDTGHGSLGFPIGDSRSVYNRVKCFVMLKDTASDGGPLGLVPVGPTSHR